MHHQLLLKKTGTWLAENRRNIERLEHVRSKVQRSGILKGAVGSYLGLGEKAIETEAIMMKKLGLAEPQKMIGMEFVTFC